MRTEAEMRQLRADSVKETSIEGHFIKRAKEYRCRQRKMTQYYAEDGWPDRICVWVQGAVDFCELKRPKGSKAEPRQPIIQADLRARGCNVEVLSTKEQVDEYFARRAAQLGVAPVKRPRKKGALLSADELAVALKGQRRVK